MNRMIVMTSLLAIMTALTAVQSGPYVKTFAYAYIQNDNELSNGDTSTTVPTHDPFLIVIAATYQLA